MNIHSLIATGLLSASLILPAMTMPASAAQGCGAGKIRDIHGKCVARSSLCPGGWHASSDGRQCFHTAPPMQGRVKGNWQGAADGEIWGGDPHPYWGPAWHDMWGY